MFAFLRTLFRRWLEKHERHIFRFWDGRTERAVDPMLAFRGLATHPRYNPEVHPPLVDVGDHDALDAMLQAARDVFGVKAYDGATGEGLTENETIDLMVSFAQFVGGVKKKPNPSPTSLPSTDPPGSADSPTSSNSECGSVSREPAPEKPSET
jgi:hypothetical protein